MGQKGRIKAFWGNDEASGTRGIFIGSLNEARLCISEKAGREINSSIVINKENETACGPLWPAMLSNGARTKHTRAVQQCLVFKKIEWWNENSWAQMATLMEQLSQGHGGRRIISGIQCCQATNLGG